MPVVRDDGWIWFPEKAHVATVVTDGAPTRVIRSRMRIFVCALALAAFAGCGGTTDGSDGDVTTQVFGTWNCTAAGRANWNFTVTSLGAETTKHQWTDNVAGGGAHTAYVHLDELYLIDADGRVPQLHLRHRRVTGASHRPRRNHQPRRHRALSLRQVERGADDGAGERGGEVHQVVAEADDAAAALGVGAAVVARRLALARAAAAVEGLLHRGAGDRVDQRADGAGDDGDEQDAQRPAARRAATSPTRNAPATVAARPSALTAPEVPRGTALPR